MDCLPGKKSGCCKQEASVERWPSVEVRLYTYLRSLNVHLTVIFPHVNTGRDGVKGATQKVKKLLSLQRGC